MRPPTGTRCNSGSIWILVLFLCLFPRAWPQQSGSFSPKSYDTLGNPFTALATKDSKYVFVSVTNVGGPNYSTPDSEAGKRHGVVSGIQVFQNDEGTLRSIGLVRLGGKGANGIAFVPGEKTLVVAAGDLGVAFVNVQDAIQGTAKPYFVNQGVGAGSWDVVATPDGRYVFSANEYGIFQAQRGNVGVIELHSDASGRVEHARVLGFIPAGNKVPSLTLSPDGSRLYVVREILPNIGLRHIAGTDNPMLTKHDCVQIVGSAPKANGVITVIDVKRAISSGSGERAILAEVAAGCSPVRATETSDGSILYVSARGDNRILTYSPHQLDSDPGHAFLRGFDSGGVAPVGVRLLQDGRLLAVANSNRFKTADGGVVIFDISKPSTPALIKSISSGAFPRNINAAPDGRSFFVTNYSSRTLEVVTIPTSETR
jgi:DNA-binding beta-propeller fold protein YncE